MKKYFFILIFLIASLHEANAQWGYISSIESGLDADQSNYSLWLKNNGFTPTGKFDMISDRKAASLSTIYNHTVTSKVFESKRQPIKIHCYTDTKQKLKAIDIFLINPERSEYESIQLVLLKSGFKLLSESVNESEKTTRTYFQKEKIRLNLSSAEDRSFLTISATTLSNYE